MTRVALPTFLEQLGGFLPATAVIALLVFVVREFLEWRRRRSSERRKIASLKVMMARECERNLGTLKSLQSAVQFIKNREDDENLFIIRTPAGHLRFSHRSSISNGSFILRPVYLDEVGKSFPDFASLDSSGFKLFEAAYDQLFEMKHIRDSIIDYFDEAADPEDAYSLGFADYADAELKNIYRDLDEFYIYCSGKKLETYRL